MANGSHSQRAFRYCQVGESRPNIVGLEDAPSTISWGRIGLEALNLTIPTLGMEVHEVSGALELLTSDDLDRVVCRERLSWAALLGKEVFA